MNFKTFNSAMNGIHAEFVTDAMYFGEKRRKSLLRLPAAALIAIITALILALAAGATVLFDLDDVLRDFLGISESQSDLLRDSVMEINKSQTIDGMTVTLRQAFGDAHTVYVLAEVYVPKGITLEGRLQGLVAEIDTKNNGGSYSFTKINVDEDNRIQSYLITIVSDKKIIGRNLTLSFSTYVSLPYVERLVDGVWDFKFKLNYADTARVFSLNDTRGELIIRDVTITPASIMISVEGLSSDDLSLDEFSVILDDGCKPELIRYQYLGQGNVNSKRVINIYGKFVNVIDVDSVYAITVNDRMIVLKTE